LFNIFALTDKESSFYVFNVMKFSRSFLLKSMHKDWYICQSRKTKLHGSTDVQLDFYNGDPDVLERCTFSFEPIAQYEDKYKNCKNVAGPVTHPSISGQPLQHPAHLVPETPPSALTQPSCIPVCPAGTMGERQGGQNIVPRRPAEPAIPSSESNQNFSAFYFST